MVWELFSNELKKLVKERFDNPTNIQQQVIPKILEGKNCLVMAETGSGKTESCLLPILNSWTKEKPKPISILYITPLKSLNRNLLDRILWWGNKLNMDVSVRHGDTTQYERSMQAANPPDLLISTPETLQAVLVGKVMREHLKNIKYVVVDEVHELVGSKRGVQLSIGLERLKNLIGKDIQIIGLSATIGSPEKVADFLTGGNSCEIINTVKVGEIKIHVESPETKKEDIDTSEDVLLNPNLTARLRRINELTKNRDSVLIFTNTRKSAEVLSSRLKIIDDTVEAHHSSLSKNVRINAEKKFKEREIKRLICTSSLELGIDIGSIDFILQYMSPRQVTKLIQRVGRSGHTLDKTSEGVIIASEADDLFESAIIAGLAKKNKIEKTMVYEKSLDVLAHQIVGLNLEEYGIPFEKIYNLIKMAYPFRNLESSECFEVCKMLQNLGVIWMEEENKKIILKRRKKSWEYYYQNLSTIPDSRNYKIFDVVSNQVIGTLDAEFIALHGTPGNSFICKGQAWKILELRGDRIFAQPMMGLEASIPAWDGELIPIQWEVSQEVGAIRKKIEKGLDDKNLIENLTKSLPITKNLAEKLINIIRKQKKFGFVPNDKEVLIEYFPYEKNYHVVIHSCFGSLVNETLGRILSTLLKDKVGSVGLKTDAYRIILTFPENNWELVVDYLKNINPKEMKKLLELNLTDTELFRWRFIHVAKRFGIIKRDADFGKAYLRKVAEVYSGTPVYREAMNEIFQEKLDLEQTKKVLEMIKSGEIKIEVRQGLSPLGQIGLERRYEIVPGKSEQEIFKLFKNRLMETKVGLLCTQCGGLSIKCRVKSLPELICPKCKAKLITVVPPGYLDEAQKLIKKNMWSEAGAKEKPNKEENRYLKLMINVAALVINYGKDAVAVLAGRGIGPETAKRVLGKLHTGDDLLKDILEQERKYAETRRFWKD